MQRYTMTRARCANVMQEDPEGEYVRYDDANAEAADLSRDLHAREERCLALAQELEETKRLLEIANARVRALEGLLEKTQDDWAAYLTTRGM